VPEARKQVVNNSSFKIEESSCWIERASLLGVVGSCWILAEPSVNNGKMKLNLVGGVVVGLSVMVKITLATDAPSLWPIQQALAGKKFVDLTHEFAPGIPRWPGFPDESRKIIYWYDKRPDTMGAGFFAEVYTLVGQWGTHVDPPAHFVKGLRTVDQIDLKEMVLPLVVVDVHEECEKTPDYTLTIERLKKWETEHGQIPVGAFVAMRTDWSKRWPDATKMENKDAKGVAHYPGWSMPALKFLYQERKITASGHETTDTDPGIATSKDDYSLETYILSTNHYQIELLTNLDQVPEVGAIVVVSFPKPKGGSGFPARAFAILP
jgi:kynurenine formamidase